MCMGVGVRIYPIDDNAITVAFDLPIGEVAHRKVMLLQRALQENKQSEILEIVPAYNSLAIYFVTKTPKADLLTFVKQWADKVYAENNENDLTDLTNESHVVIPVCYEPAYASDIITLSKILSISQEDIVLHHSKKSYQVFMNGFIPGFAYMGTLDPILHLPRKQTPTLRVPAGSVAIAASQTGIYPLEVSGGWHIIGRTPIKMFDKKRNPACLLQPGQTVSFRPITSSEFQNWS